MSATLDVLKLLKSNEVRALQRPNILFISVTLDVSIFHFLIDVISVSIEILTGVLTISFLVAYMILSPPSVDGTTCTFIQSDSPSLTDFPIIKSVVASVVP